MSPERKNERSDQASQSPQEQQSVPPVSAEVAEASADTRAALSKVAEAPTALLESLFDTSEVKQVGDTFIVRIEEDYTGGDSAWPALSSFVDPRIQNLKISFEYRREDVRRGAPRGYEQSLLAAVNANSNFSYEVDQD